MKNIPLQLFFHSALLVLEALFALLFIGFIGDGFLTGVSVFFLVAIVIDIWLRILSLSRLKQDNQLHKQLKKENEDMRRSHRRWKTRQKKMEAEAQEKSVLNDEEIISTEDIEDLESLIQDQNRNQSQTRGGH